MKFNTNATSLDLDNAFVCAKLSQIVYKTEHEIHDYVRSEGLNYKYFNKKSNQCLIAWNDSDIFVAFAGTDLKQMQDILDDLDAKCVRNINCGCVHEGFYTRAIEANTWFTETFFEDIYKDRKFRHIWITGHSLGGAIAIVFADMFGTLTSFGDAVAGIYTFGQPRVGNGKFVKCFNQKFGKKTYRFVHACDIVPRVPSVISGYRNNDTMIYINSKDEIQTVGFFGRTLDRLRDFFLNLEKINVPEIKEHYIENYIKILIKLKIKNMWEKRHRQ